MLCVWNHLFIVDNDWSASTLAITQRLRVHGRSIASYIITHNDCEFVHWPIIFFYKPRKKGAKMRFLSKFLWKGNDHQSRLERFKTWPYSIIIFFNKKFSNLKRFSRSNPPSDEVASRFIIFNYEIRITYCIYFHEGNDREYRLAEAIWNLTLSHFLLMFSLFFTYLNSLEIHKKYLIYDTNIYQIIFTFQAESSFNTVEFARISVYVIKFELPNRLALWPYELTSRFIFVTLFTLGSSAVSALTSGSCPLKLSIVHMVFLGKARGNVKKIERSV